MEAKIILCRDHREASQKAADLVAEAFVRNPELTVTFAAGDTPLASYQELIARQEKGEVQLDKARYIGLDEWVGLGLETEGSCIATMTKAYYRPAGIPASSICVFDGLSQDPEAEVERMQGVLQQHPLDLAVLGIGVNGHVGFNEPGVSTSGDFSLVPLSASTQQVGKKYFAGQDTVKLGATITLEALKKAKQVVIIATGASKREAVSSILEKRTDLPACAFLDHPNACYLFDQQAADGTFSL